MPTYVYETVTPSPERFEIRQAFGEPALTADGQVAVVVSFTENRGESRALVRWTPAPAQREKAKDRHEPSSRGKQGDKKQDKR